MTQTHSVGINVGTTWASLAYVDQDRMLSTLRFDDGSDKIAAAVFVTPEGKLVVGDQAISYATFYPDRMFRMLMHCIGDKRAGLKCDGKTYRPQQLLAMVLRTLLQSAEPVIGKVERAVLSVPSVFGVAQRQATIDAGQIAGLDKVHLIDEPVAAGITYGHKLFADTDRWESGELDETFTDETVLVYELRANTFTATLMRIGKDGSYEVLCTTADRELGGDDWDDVLLIRICNEYEAVTGDSVRDNAKQMRTMRQLARKAKCALSERLRVGLKVAVGNHSVMMKLKRSDFERATRFLLCRTTDMVQEMLVSSQRTWSHIDRILLAGGGCRMPMVNTQLALTTGRSCDIHLSEETAKARGAALFADYYLELPQTPASSRGFDPYIGILGLDETDSPPDFYTLLGLPKFTQDEQTIESASRDRLRFVRPFCAKYPAEGTELLNVITKAKLCLLDTEERAAYDAKLRADDARVQPPSPAASCSQEVTTFDERVGVESRSDDTRRKASRPELTCSQSPPGHADEHVYDSLGGDAIEERIVDRMCDLLRGDSGIPLPKVARDRRKLRLLAQNARMSLREAESTQIEFIGRLDGKLCELDFEMRRDELEEILIDATRQTTDLAKLTIGLEDGHDGRFHDTPAIEDQLLRGLLVGFADDYVIPIVPSGARLPCSSGPYVFPLEPRLRKIKFTIPVYKGSPEGDEIPHGPFNARLATLVMSAAPNQQPTTLLLTINIDESRTAIFRLQLKEDPNVCLDVTVPLTNTYPGQTHLLERTERVLSRGRNTMSLAERAGVLRIKKKILELSREYARHPYGLLRLRIIDTGRVLQGDLLAVEQRLGT